MKRTGIGILGAGAISGIYLENLCRLFTETEVVGVYDPVSYTHLDVYKRQLQ